MFNQISGHLSRMDAPKEPSQRLCRLISPSPAAVGSDVPELGAGGSALHPALSKPQGTCLPPGEVRIGQPFVRRGGGGSAVEADSNPKGASFPATRTRDTKGILLEHTRSHRGD